MKKLVGFELKKIYSIKFLKLFVIILLIANIFNIYTNYDLMVTPEEYMINSEFCEIDKIKHKMDTDYEGTITPEKVNALKEHYTNCQKVIDGNELISEELYFPSAYTDMVQTGIILEEMERIYSYSTDKISKLIQNNETLKEEAAQTDNKYSYRVTSLIKNIYSYRDLNNFYRVNEYEPLFSYKLSSLCALLLSCFVAGYLFSGEKEKAMNSLIKCTQKGKGTIFLAKQFALFIFCIFICVLLFVFDFYLFYLCRRPSGIFEPIYAMENYAYSPFNISILNFYILVCLFKILGIYSIALVSFFFSSIFRKSSLSLLCSFLSVFIFMYAGLYTDGVFSYLRYINPISLITSVNLLETFSVENVLGFPVFSFILTFIGVLFFSVVISIMTYRFSVRRTQSNA